MGPPLRICVLSAFAVVARACETADDCFGAGVCLSSGECKCDAAWSGENCTELALLPAKTGAAWRRETSSSWGGSVIADPRNASVHYMFAADMALHCGLNSWQHNSQVSAAMSTSGPEGPFEEVGGAPVVPIFGHNPTVHATVDGHFVVFHIGSGKPTRNRPAYGYCTDGTTPASPPDSYCRSGVRSGNVCCAVSCGSCGGSGCSGRPGGGSSCCTSSISRECANFDDAACLVPSSVEAASDVDAEIESVPAGSAPPTAVSPNLAVATSLDGPWELTGGGGSSCNNPGAHFFPNGTVLLVCKVALIPAESPWRQMAIYVADSWRGPYQFRALAPVFGEDAYIWKGPRAFHMLLHTMHPHKTATTAWSPDGINWTPNGYAGPDRGDPVPRQTFSHSISLESGEVVELARRERHQVLVDHATGAPVALYNGVTLKGGGDYSFTAVQLIRRDGREAPMNWV